MTINNRRVQYVALVASYAINVAGVCLQIWLGWLAIAAGHSPTINIVCACIVTLALYGTATANAIADQYVRYLTEKADNMQHQREFGELAIKKLHEADVAGMEIRTDADDEEPSMRRRH